MISPAPSSGRERRGPSQIRVVIALSLVYLVWGSTYLAMRIALGGFPPLLMAGLRFTAAGGALFVALRLRGVAAPSLSQWARSAVVGILMLTLGNGGVAIAEQWVASGLAAVVVASVPLWAALFNGFFDRWPSRLETLGLAVGTGGVLLLNLGGDFRGQPLGAAVLLGASASWALGSVWSRQMDLPQGLMASTAQMLSGGAALLLLALLHGDRPLPGASATPLLAIVYLALFGSIVAFSAFGYLLRNVSPTLATSYAFVNPGIAVLLGVGFAEEQIRWTTVLAMAVILGGVALVAIKPRPPLARVGQAPSLDCEERC
ncbi:MAG TPA: drug/metabolite exporter YedA [Myxococcaceae bacterium]|nr:drug/metabolite exporter YedA [Myxococcaceae bacterium]